MRFDKSAQRRLSRAIEEGADVSTWRLKFVNADEFSRRLGRDWPRYEDFVRRSFADAVGSYLNADDFFLQSQDGYWIFFLSQREDGGRSRINRMVAKIHTLLARDAAFLDPAPVFDVTLAEWSDVLRFVDASAAPRPSPRIVEEPGAGSRSPGIAGEVDKPRRLPSEALPDVASSRRKRLIDYVPLWQAKTGHVIGSVCRPETPSALVPPSDEKYFEATAERLEFDIGALEDMLADLRALRAQRASATVVFPINFKTFCAPEFNKIYMRALRDIPPTLAESVMPKFVRIPQGAPQALIAEKATILAPLFERVMLQTPPQVELSRFEYASCSILTTSWRDVMRLSGGDTPNMFKAAAILDDFCRFAVDRRVKCAIEGADTLDAVELAVAVGADFVSGTAIGPRGRALVAQQALSLDDIRVSHARPSKKTQTPSPERQAPVQGRPASDPATSGVVRKREPVELARHHLEVRLVPAFDLRKRLASTLFCTPVRFQTGGALRLGRWLLDDLNEAQAAAVDIEILQSAVICARRFAETRTTVAIGFPVSLSTLLSPGHRKDYIAALRDVSLPRTNPLLIQIEGAAHDTPLAGLADAIDRIRQSGHHMMLAIPAGGNFPWSIGALGASSIGVNLTGREDLATVVALLRPLMILCRSQGALAYVNMLMTDDAVAAAAAAGVRFGTGPALSMTMFKPDGDLPKIPVAARVR